MMGNKRNNMYYFRVAHPFDAEEDVELTVNVDEIVVSRAAEPQDGWLLVSIAEDRSREGFVPISHLVPDVEESEARAQPSPPPAPKTAPAPPAPPAPPSPPTPPAVEAPPPAPAPPTPPAPPATHVDPTPTPIVATGTISPTTGSPAVLLKGTTIRSGAPAALATALSTASPPSPATPGSPGSSGSSPSKAGVVKGVVQTAGSSSTRGLPAASPLHAARRLSEVQTRLQHIRNTKQNNTLMARYVVNNAVSSSNNAAGGRVDVSMQGTDPKSGESLEMIALREQASRLRFKNRIIFKRKIVLLGYQEVGKTSLRKCFESEPFFFKRLPDVRTTTGVEVQQKNMYVDGDELELIISDFAGQESYHSHTCFLTRRAVFVLVWKVSAVEQDFHSSGINANEEERLYKWLAEVYAKFPRARIVLIATHLDELRVQGQRSVEMILSKVEGKVRGFLDRIASEAPQRRAVNSIIGNFAVSCKTRLIVAAGDRLRHLSGEKISTLLQYLTEVAREDCMYDKEYPSAAIPGRHAKLMDDIARLKDRFPRKLIMPIGELVLMAVRVGIESDAELLQVARLMHSWDMLYVFHPHRLEDNAFVMLRPQWLSRMAASLFSYAHILRTPLHLRSFIGGLEYIISHAEQADMYVARRGYIRWPLARVLFSKPLADFVQRAPDDSDTLMCLELLQSMELLYPVQVECDEYSVLEEETPIDTAVGRVAITSDKVTRYFVPSLAPFNVPAVLRRLSPLFFHRGVRVRITFNLLPDELWWRVQCRLHEHIQLISVHQPVSAMVTDDMQEEEELLTDGYRLKEADDEHNRWRDAMWLKGEGCRVFLCREGRDAISIFAAEAQAGSSEGTLRAVVFALTDLLREYEGVKQKVLVACPSPSCDGWLDEHAVATSMSVTCPTCGKQFSSDEVTKNGGGRQFAADLLTDAGELLSYSLPYASCLHLCSFLGIPYKGPVPANATATANTAGEGTEEAHAEYLHALDKVVQAALFQSWMKRVEEMEKRKRMLEVEASPVLY